MTVARRFNRQGRPYGFFLTFEGIEGTGKSTHLALLSRTLVAHGFQVVDTREPGGTKLGQELRHLLLDPKSEPPVPEAELFLLLADRAHHVRTLVLPALNAGKVVLCDRFADASVAYQGGGRKLGVERVAEGNAMATGGLAPDLTFLFDLTPEKAAERVHRRREREGSLDRLDQESIEFFGRVRAAYRAIASTEPERFVEVTTTGVEKDELAADIWCRVEPLMNDLRREGVLL